MYEKILVPLDGSDLAEVVLPYAEELTEMSVSEVTLFQVVVRGNYIYPGGAGGAVIPYTDEEMEPLKVNTVRYLEKIASRFKDKGIATRSEVRIGAAADEIIDYADKEDIGLIVMATHGRSGIGRWTLGSVANKVVRATKRPVALIRAKSGHSEMREKGILNKVLVPLDGSKESEAVIPYIEELARQLKTEVVLVQVLANSYDTITTEEYGSIIYSEKQMESDRASAKVYLDKVVAQLKQKDVPAKSDVRFGSAAEEIIKLASEMYADVVAMSTHGRRGLTRWAFGSVTDKVLRGGSVPVLMVRVKKETTEP